MIPVKGYEDKFLITEQGEVFSIRTGKVKPIKTRITKTGYLSFATKIGGRKGVAKLLKIHRLVAGTFVPNPENKPFVNHIDGNKINNNANNLEWVTNKENVQHAIKIGLWDNKGILFPGGEEHPSAKLTWNQVEEIRKMYIPYSHVYGTRALAKVFSIDASTISDIVTGKSWIKQTTPVSSILA